MLDFAILLDRSGSMQERKSDHEGGLRSFVEDQKQLPGEMRFTFIQFDTVDPCEIVLDRVPLPDVDLAKLKLIPRGGTPLLDAIGKGVAHLRSTLTASDNTVVCIITDGEENSSKEWTKPRVKALVEELEQGAWKFLFLGATLDAFAEAGALGMAAGAGAMINAASPQAVQAMYRGLGVNTGGARGQSVSDVMFMASPQGKQAMNWTVDQIAEMMNNAAAGADEKGQDKE